MTINIVLLVATLAWIGSLVGIEAYTAAKGIPTISERLQRLGRAVPLVVVTVCTLVGMLLVHFFS